ncbi:MAG: hypothetical protein J7603_08775 [Pseudacidovorax sp.]|nr:hypothetical protein [Pseudacidovorax sp.]
MSTSPVAAVPARSAWRDSVLPWIYILAAEATVPLVLLIAVAAMLYAVPQAAEALSAVSLVNSPGSLSILPYISTMLSVVVLALTAWYAARSLVTIDVAAVRKRAQVGGLSKAAMDSAATQVPRWLGTGAAILLCGAYLFSLRGEERGEVAYALVSLLVPLLITVSAFVALESRTPALGKAVVVLVPMAVAIGLLVFFAGVVDLGSAIGAALVPGLVLAFLVLRRPVLRKVTKKAVPDASEPMRYRSRWKLGVLALGLLAFLGLVAAIPPFARSVGSPAIVMLFAAGVTAVGSYVMLFLRHHSSSVPGIGVLAVAVVAAALAVGHTLMSRLSLDGSFGSERLEVDKGGSRGAPALPARKCAGAPSVMVNAYGGGIRAAVFTGQVLARLDDATEGKFGDCLVAASSVSGGSLGVASYLLLREQYLNAGYRDGCAKQEKLENWVRGELVQDHLSPALGVLLTADMLPLVTYRGEALLKSWQHGLMAQVEAHGCRDWQSRGLATPLKEITGGTDPAPHVYFNSTDVVSGRTLYFANDAMPGTGWISAQEDLLAGLDPRQLETVSVGQAVLHSARFPIVTPAGRLPAEGEPFLLLVDGGYADNSGAATLYRQIDSGKIQRAQAWVNIDGNPKECSDNPLDRGTAIQKEPTALTTLLAVRASQAQKAVAAGETRGKAITVTLDEGSLLDRCDADPTKRKRAELHRPAPLGWFITEKTAKEMDKAVSAAVSRICQCGKLSCSPAYTVTPALCDASAPAAR